MAKSGSAAGTLSQALWCTLPKSQGDDKVKDFVNLAFNTSFTANVGKQDGLNGFSVNWTGPSADIFAGLAGVSDPVRNNHSQISCMSLAVPARASMAKTASHHFSLNDLSI